MTQDLFGELKERQREMWASFAPSAIFTTPAAGQLVAFAGIRSGESVLDVATGTGVVAITASRSGARVSALDLTPELLKQARLNAQVSKQEEIAWIEGDAEKLPYADATFDVVLSQFGHMFAPQPEVVISEMRRVLKPNGRIAFATWPLEHFVGKMFSYIGRNSPPPLPGVSPPPLWGIPTVVTERMAGKFDAPFFERRTMHVPALSLAHYLIAMEQSIGPLQKLIEMLANDSQKLDEMRQGLEALAAPYYHGNVMHQDYLLTRANAI